MVRFFIMIVISSFSITTSAFSIDQIKSTIFDLEQLCHLGEDVTALDDLEFTDDESIEHSHARIGNLLQKLDSCKTRMLKSYETCEMPTIKALSSTPRSTWSKIATGCDWVIRIAGVMWALQFIYSYLS